MTKAQSATGGVKPAKDVAVTFTITETVAGKLDVRATIPDDAKGTLALALAELAMAAIREVMSKTLKQDPNVTESRLQ